MLLGISHLVHLISSRRISSVILSDILFHTVRQELLLDWKEKNVTSIYNFPLFARSNIYFTFVSLFLIFSQSDNFVIKVDKFTATTPQSFQVRSWFLKKCLKLHFVTDINSYLNCTFNCVRLSKCRSLSPKYKKKEKILFFVKCIRRCVNHTLRKWFVRFSVHTN